jgi:N-acetylated-alpha-linked acidic dipeptidase
VYDSHHWQRTYADPGFHKHVAWSKYLGTIALKLADSIILPLNTTQYSLELNSYLAK